MKRAKPTKPVRVNKLGIILLASVVHIIAYAPVVLLMQRPAALVYIVIAVLLVAILGTYKFTSRSTLAPNLAEFLLGGFEMMQIPAFVGILWMALYGVLFGIVQLLQVVVRLFNDQATMNAAGVAYYPTMVFGVLVTAIVSADSIGEVAKKLYPDTAGIRSEYFQFFSTNRSRLIRASIGSFVVLLILLALLAFHIVNPYIVYILLQITFFGMGSVFTSETRVEKTEKKKRLDVVERIRILLETVGYVTEINPRTKDASIDPLLINLDILARHDRHTLLLDIKSPVDADKTVDWKSASSLMQSAYLLGIERDIKDMDARLLLVDTEPDPSLKKMTKRNEIPLISFSSEQIDKILEIDDKEEKRKAIRSLLKLPSEGISLNQLTRN